MYLNVIFDGKCAHIWISRFCVDMRERTISIAAQSSITKDNVHVEVSGNFTYIWLHYITLYYVMLYYIGVVVIYDVYSLR